MVFRIVGGLLGIGIILALAAGYQDGEFTPRNIIMMGGIGVIFLAYAIMGPKRVQGFFTSAAGDDEDTQQNQEGKTKLS